MSGLLPGSAQCQEPQASNWVQVSEWFSTGERPPEGRPTALDLRTSIQISGWFDTPPYPPETRAPETRSIEFDSESATAGEPSGPQPVYVDGIYALNEDTYFSAAENAWRILTGPLRYDEDDWINVAITLGVTGSLLLVDEAVNNFWQGDVRGESLDDFFDIINEFGDFENIAFGTLGAYAAAEVLGAKREKAAALMILESLLLTTAVTEGIKVVTGRERPRDADDAFDFNGITDSPSQDSLPSGHASNAFAVATVIAEVYGDDNPWVPWLAYPLAGTVGLARLNQEKHFLSDLFLGGAIGYFIGKMVTHYNPFLEENGIEVKPFGQQGAQGISVAYKF